MQPKFPISRIFTVLLLLCSNLLIDCAHAQSKPFVVLTEQPIRSIAPLYASDAVSQKIVALVGRGLVRLDRTSRIVGDLAESFNANASATEYRFELRKDAKFHDGSALNSKSLALLLEEFAKAAVFKDALEGLRAVQAPKGHTLILEFDRPKPYVLNELTGMKFVDPIHGGTGSFRIEREIPNEVVLRRVKESSKRLNQIIFRHVSDEASRYQALIRNDAQAILSGLSPQKTELLKQSIVAQKNPQIEIFEAPGINYSYLSFNFRHPILQNLKVRQAISRAIDWDQIIRKKMGGLAARAHTVLASSVAYEGMTLPPLPQFSRGEAERLLDEAGFARKADGIRFRLELATSFERFSVDFAKTIAGFLEQIGIAIYLRQLEPGLLMAQFQKGEYELFNSRWVGVTNPAALIKFFYSKSSANRGAYVSVEMDRLLDEAKTQTNSRRQKDIFNRVVEIVARDLPYLSLFHWNNTLFIAKRLPDGRKLNPRSVFLWANGGYSTFDEVEFEHE